jgi:hypothetical protein
LMKSFATVRPLPRMLTPQLFRPGGAMPPSLSASI